MGKEIVYCDLCGERLLEQEFVEGKAVTLFNKNYCANCKDEAIKDLAPEEMPEEEEAPSPPPARRPKTGTGLRAAPPPEKKPPKPRKAPATPTPRPRQRAPQRAPAVSPPSKGGKIPIFVGGIVGGIAIIVLVVVMVGGKGNDGAGNGSGGGSNRGTGPDNGGNSGGGNGDSSGNKEEQGRRAYEDCKSYWDANKSNPDQVMVYIKEKRGPAAGTSWWTKIKEIEAEVELKKQQAGEEQRVKNLIEEARKAIDRDNDFDQIEEVKRILGEARGLCRRNQLDHLLPDILALEKPYLDRYEGEAQEKFDEIYPLIRTLSEDRRYKPAIQTIETFPQKYRKSQAWKSLEDLKRDFERKMRGG